MFFFFFIFPFFFCWDFKYSWKFVKASGGQIVELCVLDGHKWNYDGLKHISGQGAIYIKALKKENVVSDDDIDDDGVITLFDYKIGYLEYQPLLPLHWG